MAQQRINVQAPIARVFANRWSPRAFSSEKKVSEALVATCLEAARWAPSCYGDQPWQFVVADRFRDAQSWQATLNALVPANQQWAKQAPIFVVAVASPNFHHNGKPNRWSEYDTGQATVSFCLQATLLGLQTHQMGGFDAEKLKQALHIPNERQIMSVTALGYDGDNAALNKELQAIEMAPRNRLPLSEISHAGSWGQSFQPLLSLGWQARYEESAAEDLPWFHHGLDSDFATALTQLGLESGEALDIGCGPGTQSVALAELGFCVTASDVAQAAIDGATKRAEQSGVTIHFLTGDATTLDLTQQFDLIIDRGVLHCFADSDQRNSYVNRIRNWLKPGGVLLLKCFSHHEKREQGPPCRFSPDDLNTIFVNGFTIDEITEAAFQGGVNDQPPKALFATIFRAQ
ncbi:MAG: nitroreductase family protein [Mariprofundales bacterium]